MKLKLLSIAGIVIAGALVSVNITDEPKTYADEALADSFVFEPCNLEVVVCANEAIKTPTPSVEARIRAVAEAEGFKDVNLLLKLSFCESSNNVKAIHINKDGSKDRGAFQWNSKYQPQVSDECAYNLECSTKEVILKIRNGGLSAWVCSTKI
jgi:hypothetical protein